jgi:hypothetical protein
VICSTLVSANNVINIKQTLHIVDDAITVNIPVGAYEIKKINQRDEISVENYGRLLVPGKPNLPSRIFSVAIPPGAQVRNVTFETNGGIILPGVFHVVPCSLPRVMSQENPVLYERDLHQYEENYRSVYGQNNPYPLSIGEVAGTGGYRKYNLVDVRITPFVYYPLSGKLMYYPDITVRVQYFFPEGFSSKNIMIDSLFCTEQTAKGIILNYDQAREWYPSESVRGEQFDYVIITLDSLTSSVTPLVDWENLKGRSVNVVTTSWIDTHYEGYDLAAKIRAFLLEKYPSGEWGIEDVLLVGNRDDVPMRRMAQDIGYGEPETDYYYAELSLPDNQSWDANGNHQYGEYNYDPIDFETEINVGRIPWSEPATVSHICEKSVAFEQNNDPDFKKNILLLGAFFDETTDNAVLMEYTTNASYNPWMSGWNKTRMYEQNYSLYHMEYDVSYDNVKDVWSAGSFAFVDWAGHGSPTECVRQYPSMADFVNTQTCPYLNDTYPAIIFACACSNADSDYLNLGQSMLSQGAVGFVGSNKVSIGRLNWTSPSSGSSQTMDYYFTSFCTSGNYTQGAALQLALYQMRVHSYWNNLRYETFEWGSLLGNPDLSMGPVFTSDPPLTPPAPSGPMHGKINKEYTFSSATTDPNGDQIYYMFDWGDGTSHLWLGPYASGESVSAVHSWSVAGTYNITVKAKDFHGVTSHWSEPLPVAIAFSDPPDTPIPSGPGTGEPGTVYLYNFQTTDPEGDMVYYYINWGDNTTSGWLGPYSSGASASASHSWSQKGTYIVKVKAKDIWGGESDWGALEVKMPVSIHLPFHLFIEKLFERFPHAFPILRFLSGY